MIRVIIAVMLLFLIWVLFVSDFKRTIKILVAAATVVVCAIAVGFDVYSGKPRANLIELEQVAICDIESRHSYRTNYDIRLCLKNTAESATLKRVQFTVIAERCDATGECSVLDQVTRDIPVDLPPQKTATLTENLNFKQVPAELTDVQWRATIDSVKALK